MSYYLVIFIAIALGIDAFAVSFAAGAYYGKASTRQKFRLSFHFGLFQLIMPIIGWIAGREIVKLIENYDHWLAFLILLIIGTKMIWDTLKRGNESITNDISKGIALITLAVATSIDALAVGFSMGIVHSEIILPSIIIGIIAASMSLAGIRLGETLSSYFGRKISVFGGIVLIAIGLKILLEHLNVI